MEDSLEDDCPPLLVPLGEDAGSSLKPNADERTNLFVSEKPTVDSSPVPVTVLTGYLGAGKTTLL